MSMLSSQVDELRETADRLDKIAEISTPWIHRNLTPMLREAADTIWELRNRLMDLSDVEIVRCRDCKRYNPKRGQALSCKFEYRDLVLWCPAEPNGFCAWGRKEG